MKTLRYSRLFAAGAAVMMVSGGCTSMGGDRVAVSGSDGADLKSASRASEAAAKAARQGDVDQAIALAEDAVMAAPEEAAYRARLGLAYQQGGRFQSAEQAFAEARVLGDDSARTIVSHALSLTANGQTDAARELVTSHRTDISASDYGLALALMGETDLSIAVLEDAVRNGGPSQQARQNLGFAYAMAGRWRESQMVAQQDLGPVELRQRMTEWAQLARPGAYQERVAAMLGVSPVQNDTGMPVLLALDKPVSEAIATAPVAPSPYSGASLAAVDLVAQPTFGDMEISAVDFAEQNMRVVKAVTPAFAPVPVVEQTAPVAVATPAPAGFVVEQEGQPTVVAPASKAKKAQFATSAEAVSVAPASQYVIQLGAYSTAANADRAWAIHAKRYPLLQKYTETGSEVTLGGRKFHRVGATGFASATEARDICRKIKALGGQCLVKPVSGFSSR